MMKTIFLIACSLWLSFGMAQDDKQSPVQGDDLLQLLGKRKNSAPVGRLNDFIGNKDPKENLSFLNYGKGIQVNFENSMVMGIDFYNNNNPYSDEFKQFPGTLPFDIHFDNTIFQVKQKIEEPFEAVGEVTSTYNLIKTFALNNDDDCKMTIEFQQGRLNMLSITYIQGGSSEEETTAEGPGQGGFSGNDFFVMMKKNQYNHEFSRFIAQLGKPALKEKYKQLYIEDGVEIIFNQDKLIKQITLYSGGQQSGYKGEVFKPYTNLLPYGIKIVNSRSAIINKMGPPRNDSGNVLTYKEGYCKFTITLKGDKINYLKFELDQNPEDIPENNVKGRK